MRHFEAKPATWGGISRPLPDPSKPSKPMRDLCLTPF
jgi:hypothetical protein